MKKITSLKELDYPEYYPQLTEEQQQKIINHYYKNEKYIQPIICAYYSDWKDFCSDWCDNIGYTKTQARELLNNKYQKGEFVKLNTGEIIRFVC